MKPIRVARRCARWLRLMLAADFISAADIFEREDSAGISHYFRGTRGDG
jgi:hypothetical protein